jgi:hypothetical protein
MQGYRAASELLAMVLVTFRMRCHRNQQDKVTESFLIFPALYRRKLTAVFGKYLADEQHRNSP